MIIFLADGRLGNQIFQYMFLKTIQKNNEKIIVSGFEDLLNVFDIDDKTLFNINKKNRWARRLIYKILKPILNKLSDIKLISCFAVEHEKVLNKYRRETTNYTITNGLFGFIKFARLGFFQSEYFFNKELVGNLKVKKVFIKQAKQFLKPIDDKYKIFIHIRRGDYKNFKVYGKNTLLPMKYFHNQIEWFMKNKDNLYFIFLSDELEFIEKEFNYLKNKIISKNSYEVDFAIMTLCNSAILSPSSFGWWGSYLMKERDIVFAPKYWLGFESKKQFHKEPSAKFIRKINI